MKAINPYLTFNGNCEEAMEFYAQVFDAQIVMKSRFKEMPPDPNFKVSDADGEKLMHSTLQLTPDTVIMASDTIGKQAEKLVAGNNFTISINAESKEEVDRLFSELSEDGTVTMVPNITFWGSYFGMCTDKFGISWMFSSEC